ncbi:MAG: HD domain-containing phosphohydrolase, partial [Actinomycetota bacterium]
SILVVDDDEAMLMLLTRLLERAGYPCRGASSAREAKEMLAAEDFAIMLTDMTMPGESGLDLVLYVNKEHPNTASIMVTGTGDLSLATTALVLGAYGYIVKPFEQDEMLINIANALRRRVLEIQNRTTLDRLEQMVKERTQELWNAISQLQQAELDLKASREETVQRLATAAEYRDDETARHIQRMSRYCGLLAELHDGDAERADMIRVAAIMHDVGKIGIPDKILLKPGPLTDEERSRMQEHTNIGHKILEGSVSPFLQVADAIALTHHEWYDGSGYPSGLKGEQIPIEGRIAAIADVFDALTSDRVYKKAFPIGKAVETMQELSGSQFDPELLEVFLGNLDKVLDIRAAYDDPSA